VDLYIYYAYVHRVIHNDTQVKPYHIVFQAGRLRTGQTKNYAGEATLSRKAFLTLNYPIEHGDVTNWDDIVNTWHHTFYNVLQVAPEKHPALLREVPLNPQENREKMTEVWKIVFSYPF